VNYAERQKPPSGCILLKKGRGGNGPLSSPTSSVSNLMYYSAANRESCVSSSELIKPTDSMILAESGDQHAGCFRTNVARARW